MGLGEGMSSGCGCGLGAARVGLSKRLSRSLESLRPRSRASRRQSADHGPHPSHAAAAADPYTICQSMGDVATAVPHCSNRLGPQSGMQLQGEKENLGAARARSTGGGGGGFGRGLLQRSSGRGHRRVAPDPTTPDE